MLLETLETSSSIRLEAPTPDPAARVTLNPNPTWELPELGVPYFGVLIIRILLFRVLY